MNTRQQTYLAGLEQIVSLQIRTRHRLVCGKSDARRAIAGLRKVRAMIAAGFLA